MGPLAPRHQSATVEIETAPGNIETRANVDIAFTEVGHVPYLVHLNTSAAETMYIFDFGLIVEVRVQARCSCSWVGASTRFSTREYHGCRRFENSKIDAPESQKAHNLASYIMHHKVPQMTSE